MFRGSDRTVAYCLRFLTVLCAVLTLPYSAHAACAPGIPCVGYDIYSNPTAGTDPAWNGPKTGTSAPYNNVSGATTSACDGNFMNQIYSQAMMNAHRETIMSEQLIHKPDSVLEYTCFDQWVKIAAEHAGKIFTETKKWENHEICLSTGDDRASPGRPPTCPNGSGQNIGGPQSVTINVVFPDDHLDNVLEPFLFPILDAYISGTTINGNVDGSFDHTFLGEATTIDNDIDTSAITPHSYNCSHMSTVWNIAKCLDFMEDDRFRTFEDLVNADPRTIPAECSPGHSASDTITAGDDPTKLDNTSPGDPVNAVMDPCPATGGTVAGVNTNFANDFIRLANNCDDSANINSFVVFDIMKLYGDLLLGVQTPNGHYIPGTGGVSSGTVTCSNPIPTGIPVVTFEHDNIGLGMGQIFIVEREPFIHYEYVCPNPGCYYRPQKQPYVINDPVPASTPVGQCLPY